MGFFTAKTWSKYTRLGVLALAVLIGSSCRYFEEDESGGSLSLSQLRGTWLGILRHPDGSLESFSIAVDEASNITSVNGDTGRTGALELYTGAVPFEGFRLYEFTVGDGVTTDHGGFFADAIFTHATIVFENGDFAVVQRGLGAMPNFINQDLERRWTGVVKARFVTWDSNFEVSATGDWEFRTELPDPAIGNQIPYKKSALKTAPIAGYFTKDPDPQWGVWIGQDPPPAPPGTDPRPLVALMAGDKDYVGTLECGPAGFPECEFTVWGIALLQTDQ